MIEKRDLHTYHQVMATLDLMEQSGQDESERSTYRTLAREGGKLFQETRGKKEIHSLKENRENT